MLLRLRMYLLFHKLEALFAANDDYLDRSQISDIISSPKWREALVALSECDAIDIDYGDSEIYAVSLSDGYVRYLLNRSDLWWNRIIAFISGVATTLIVQLIMRLAA